MLGYYAAVALAAGALLIWSTGRPHATAPEKEEPSTAPVTTSIITGQVTAHFPPAEIAKFRTIAADTLAKVQAGDQTGATARIKDLETAWDEGEATLRPMDGTAWKIIDGQIDDALHAARAHKPDPATETQTLTALLNALH
jgi:PPE-repeat protein